MAKLNRIVYLLTVLWVGLLAGIACSKIVGVPVDEEERQMVGFSASSDWWNKHLRSTKSGRGTPISELLIDDEMVVHGYYTGEVDEWLTVINPPLYPYFMDGVVVTNTPNASGDDVWSYSPPRYYHASGWHTFLAIRGHGMWKHDGRNTLTLDENHLPVLDYTLHEDERKLVDLQMGVANYKTTEGVTTGDNAKITFQHATTRFSFKGVRSADCDFHTARVKSITLINVCSTGKLSFDIDEIDGDGSVSWFNWTLDPTLRTDVGVSTQDGTLVDDDIPMNGELLLTPEGGDLFVLPMALALPEDDNDANEEYFPELYIRIEVQHEPAGPIIDVERTAKFDLAFLKMVEPGKHINIKLICTDQGDLKVVYKLVDPGDNPDPGEQLN